MVHNDCILSNILDSVRDTIDLCSKGLKTSAMLRNIKYLKTVVENDACWSGKFHMLQWFNKIRDDLLKITDTDGVVLNFGSRVQFTNKFRA